MLCVLVVLFFLFFEVFYCMDVPKVSHSPVEGHLGCLNPNGIGIPPAVVQSTRCALGHIVMINNRVWSL